MVCWVLDQFADGDHVEFDRMWAQVVWQINRVADCQQVKSTVGWSVSLDEFRLIPLLRDFDFQIRFLLTW
jgi:hypothetical protein